MRITIAGWLNQLSELLCKWANRLLKEEGIPTCTDSLFIENVGMSSYRQHAWREFKAAGWLDEHGLFKDSMQELLCEGVCKLLDVFADEGHSGFSAPYAVDLFKRLAMFEPLVPLTGEDWEWNEVHEVHDVLQNKRCSHVFKQADRFNGQAYDNNAVIFYDIVKGEDGEEVKSYFTCRESAQPIAFPYTPERKYQERQSKDQ